MGITSSDLGLGVPCCHRGRSRAGVRRRSTKPSALARRAWAAPSSPSPTTRRRPGGTRRASRVTYFSTVIERGEVTEPAEGPPAGPAWRSRTQAFAAAFPALGLSYYRLRISEIAPLLTTADGQPGRQDNGEAGTSLRSLVAHQFGATVGQSLGSHLVIASTLRLVRAGLAGGSTSAGGAFDAADELAVPLETQRRPRYRRAGDGRVGAYRRQRQARQRAGIRRGRVSVRHEAAGARRACLGHGPAAGRPSTLTTAADADLTTDAHGVRRREACRGRSRGLASASAVGRARWSQREHGRRHHVVDQRGRQHRRLDAVFTSMVRPRLARIGRAKAGLSACD